MVERKRNLVKNEKKRSPLGHTSQPASKKTKMTALQRRYPTAPVAPTDDDDESVKRHMKSLDVEMERDKPRDHLLLPLMKSTFSARRMVIQNFEQPVIEFLTTFKAFKRISVVSIFLICCCIRCAINVVNF